MYIVNAQDSNLDFLFNMFCKLSFNYIQIFTVLYQTGLNEKAVTAIL